MIKKTGIIFLNYFPNEKAKGLLAAVNAIYERGAERRNEIAHGVVARHAGRSPGHSGHYLGPSAVAFGKRDNEFKPTYLYSTAELGLFREDNQQFQYQIGELTNAISIAYTEGTEGARSRY